MSTTKNGKKNTKRVAIVGTTVAALLGGGIAFAAWTSTGSGTGTATAGDDQGLVVTPNSSTPLLVPNEQTTMTVHVANNNPFAVHIDSIALKDVADAITSDKAGCSGASLTVTPDSYDNTTETTADDPSHVVPGNSSTDFDLTVAMSNAAPDECKNAAFTIKLDGQGHSVSDAN